MWNRPLWQRVVLIGLAAVLVMGVAGGGTVWYLSRSLPAIEGLREYQAVQVTRVYSDDNRLLGQFYIEQRTFVPLTEMPKVLFQAVIAVEDTRFYEHGGFDPFRMIRALVTNIESLRFRQGASTITQQLARSLFLTPEKHLARKVKEILLATKIEQVLTKDEILELYLNQIYFGHGAYGVQAASRFYFGQDVQGATLAQAAFLAGLPKAPTDYSPYFHPDRARSRQLVVLHRMLDQGFITGKEYTQATNEPFRFQPLRRDEDLAPHVLDQIRQHLVAAYGEPAVYRHGLEVYTTVNIEMQRAAVDAVTSGVEALDKRQGYRGPVTTRPVKDLLAEKAGRAGPPVLRGGMRLQVGVVRVTPEAATVVTQGLTGKILLDDMAWARRRLRGPAVTQNVVTVPDRADAILKPGDVVWASVKRAEGVIRFTLEQEPVVEGALLAMDPRTGEIKAMVGGYDFKRSEFNRALSAKRQPGSVFKPFIYATAIEQGLTPATIIMDAPLVFRDADDREWKPENYDEKFVGPISLREALVHSRNLATIRLLERVGVRPTIELAHKVGITSDLEPNLTLALGSSGMGLVELVSAYGVFATEGVLVQPFSIRMVQDAKGQVLEQRDEPVTKEVLAKQTAYLVTSMLQDVITRGTGRQAKSLERPLAGKTGTTNNYTDAWFIGYSPSLVAGVWVGFDDVRTLGNRESGAVAALPIWIPFMRTALADRPVEEFPVPDNVVTARVDPATGLLAPPGMEGAVEEVFVKGTEPTSTAKPATSPARFFKIDLASQ